MSAQVEPPLVKKQKCSEPVKTCAECAEIIIGEESQPVVREWAGCPRIFYYHYNCFWSQRSLKVDSSPGGIEQEMFEEMGLTLSLIHI